MILDRISNIDRYVSINPLFNIVVQFIRDNDINHLELGERQIKGTDITMNVCIATAKDKKDAHLEAHRKYIDIQLPLEYNEMMGYSPLSLCQPVDAKYDDTHDIVFFENEATNYLSVAPGMFTIFFPEDAHAPCIGTHDGKKIIFKIKNEI